ncbi:hypothetical protein RJ639_029428, partial [Escallonia herrerae]
MAERSPLLPRHSHNRIISRSEQKGSTEYRNEQNRAKPHAVMVPNPAQGHVFPMLKVAKLLYTSGFHVTFVNTQYNHRRLLRSGGATALDLSSFRFAAIPDGLPLVDDGVMSFTLEAAEELGVPNVLFWTTSACGFLAMLTIANWWRRGSCPSKLLEKQSPEPDELKHIQLNLLKEESECLEWLDSKEPNSVIYVNFGSVARMTLEQLIEFAWGLANSKQKFLWSIRPDLVISDSSALPLEFEA